VTSLPVSLVVNPVPRVAEASLPELHRRAVLPRRALRRPRRILDDHTALDESAASRPFSRCNLCVKLSTPTRSRAAPVNRCRPLPLAVVGEFSKTCHPRNVEFYEIREMSFQES
jgi:hypothetical protein